MTPPASVVVDTMVMSALVDAGRDPGAAERSRSAIDGRSVVVSFVTITEMRFGAIKAGWGEIRRRGLERVLSRLVVVQPDDDLMRTWAELRATCRTRARPRSEGPRGRPLGRIDGHRTNEPERVRAKTMWRSELLLTCYT